MCLGVGLRQRGDRLLPDPCSALSARALCRSRDGSVVRTTEVVRPIRTSKLSPSDMVALRLFYMALDRYVAI